MTTSCACALDGVRNWTDQRTNGQGDSRSRMYFLRDFEQQTFSKNFISGRQEMQHPILSIEKIHTYLKICNFAPYSHEDLGVKKAERKDRESHC